MRSTKLRLVLGHSIIKSAQWERSENMLRKRNKMLKTRGRHPSWLEMICRTKIFCCPIPRRIRNKKENLYSPFTTRCSCSCLAVHDSRSSRMIMVFDARFALNYLRLQLWLVPLFGVEVVVVEVVQTHVPWVENRGMTSISEELNCHHKTRIV